MIGWHEDLVYTLFLFWGPGLLLVASIPGPVRTVVGFLAAIAFTVVWHKFMGGTPLGYLLAGVLVVLGFIGRKRPKTNDPEAGKLLIIPFMLLLSGVAWMAMGPIWQERHALRQLPELTSVEVDGRPIQDLEAFRAALSGSESCGDVPLQLSQSFRLTLEAGGQRREYRLVYHPERPGLIVMNERQLLFSPELLKVVRRAGIKVPKG